MPKLSFAQTVVEIRETVAAVRSMAGVLPKLALTVADTWRRRWPRSRS